MSAPTVDELAALRVASLAADDALHDARDVADEASRAYIEARRALKMAVTWSTT